MRLFQNSGLYPAYRQRLDYLANITTTFEQRLDIFLNDRFGACHFLKPILDRLPSAFFTNGDDETLQRRWAKEQGMSGNYTLEDILLAQIEHHRTEVFYNLDPMRYPSNFIHKLPGCVLKSIAWRSAPSPRADFAAYDLVICNFPSILQSYKRQGWKSAYFSPAYDHEMEAYACNMDRPIDVLFIGGYSRHHHTRSRLLETIAAQDSHFNVMMYLDSSRLTRLSEFPVMKLLPYAKKYQRPPSVAKIAQPPVFGRDLYHAIGQAKIVLNGAIDMAGMDRGNMRCFEAMGCGAMMISDFGNYPPGMIHDRTMRVYSDPAEVVELIHESLNTTQWKKISRNGHEMIQKKYSKLAQWHHFNELI